MPFKAIIWDLGNVLIDWNPKYVFEKLIQDEEKRSYFFTNICTFDWNEAQDAGYPIKQATEDLIAKFPDWKPYIEAYYGRWTEMLGGPIEETVALFETLQKGGKYKMYALTNWSAELFPIALQRYPFLHLFDGRVVSGEEKLRKPNPLFYQVLLDRFSLQASEVLFIDDNERNIEAAKKLGIQSIRFTSATALKTDLQQLAIL